MHARNKRHTTAQAGDGGFGQLRCNSVADGRDGSPNVGGVGGDGRRERG
jgi:hypothetical protein